MRPPTMAYAETPIGMMKLRAYILAPVVVLSTETAAYIMAKDTKKLVKSPKKAKICKAGAYLQYLKSLMSLGNCSNLLDKLTHQCNDRKFMAKACHKHAQHAALHS